MPEMSRGEMIRRLDAVSKEVLERLTNGPLEDDQRHALARNLIRLLPLVADDLQEQEDKQAASKLLEHTERWDVEAKASQRLDMSEARTRMVDESNWK